ncbi:hypothetical protein [Streptomyces benahoarensis]|nr:hypothetical protein [Streptomyces benahoarensis]
MITAGAARRGARPYSQDTGTVSVVGARRTGHRAVPVMARWRMSR